jgi:formylglycine-generating enzyme required for sulfatase activity
MRFVLIPAGTFTMGSPPTEKGRSADEVPHEVTLTRAWYLQTTEVTNAQFRRFRPTHDSGKAAGRSLDGERQPVTLVHHVDAMDIARWVGEQDPAHAYRLPTEAEWERAARAGTATTWWWGDDMSALPRYANFGDRQGHRLAGFANAFVLLDDGFAVSAPVASFQASPWGLYDMLGNVWECCSDGFAPYPKGPVQDPKGPRQVASRVYRGSAYRHVPEMERPALRFFSDPTHALDDGGIRLAADVPGP